MRDRVRSALFAVVAVACGGRLPPPVAPAELPASLLDAARARPVPDLAQARMNIRLRSKPLDLAASTGAGLVVERPGKVRFDLMGPLGGPLLVINADGTGLSALLVGASRHLLAAEADSVVREASGGVADLDTLAALLVGDVPFDGMVPSAASIGDDGALTVKLPGPDGAGIELVVASDGTPRRVHATDPNGGLLLSADYALFQDVGGVLMPSDLILEVPQLELVIEVKYKVWSVPESSPVDFSVAPPDGVASESLEDAVRKALTGA